MRCSREGCQVEFEPRRTGGHPQRYCSTTCRKWMDNHSSASKAAKARYNRSEKGLERHRKYSQSMGRVYANARYEGSVKGLQRSIRFRLARNLNALEEVG